MHRNYTIIQMSTLRDHLQKRNTLQKYKCVNQLKMLYLIVLRFLQYFSNIPLNGFFKWKTRTKCLSVFPTMTKQSTEETKEKTYNLSCPGFVLHSDCLLEKKDNNIQSFRASRSDSLHSTNWCYQLTPSNKKGGKVSS